MRNKKQIDFLITGVLLLGMCVNAWAADNEIERLREQARVERIKEEELRLLALDLERVKMEAERKKVLVESGETGQVQSKDRALTAAESLVVPEIVLRNIFIAPQRKEIVLDVNGVRTRLQEGEKSGLLLLKKVRANEGVFVYNGQETIVKIQP